MGKKQQVPPLRFAPVGMTILLQGQVFSLKPLGTQQNCHPDRSEPGFPATRHPLTTTSAAFRKESRMKLTNATNLNRKSGVA